MTRRPQVFHVAALPHGVLLYTKPQMAAAMQVSVRRLTGMMQRGEMSYLKIHGRLVRFRPEDVRRRLSETSLVCNNSASKEAANEQPGKGSQGRAPVARRVAGERLPGAARAAVGRLTGLAGRGLR